jgi:hypothetical protein
LADDAAFGAQGGAWLMRRRVALAGLAALALSAGAPAVAQSDNRADLTRAWLKSLDASGWIRSSLSADERTVGFRKPAEPRPDGTMVMWERFERRDEDSGQWRSLVALSEFNCQERRIRTLQETTYSEPNLGGSAATAAMPGDWTYPIPGSMMESSMRLACEPPKANKAKAVAAEPAATKPPKAPAKKAATAKKKPAAKKPPPKTMQIPPPETPPA